MLKAWANGKEHKTETVEDIVHITPRLSTTTATNSTRRQNIAQ